MFNKYEVDRENEKQIRDQRQMANMIKQHGKNKNERAAVALYQHCIAKDPKNQIYYNHMMSAAESLKQLYLVEQIFDDAMRNEGYNAAFLNNALTTAAKLDSVELVRKLYLYIIEKISLKSPDLENFLTVAMIAAKKVNDFSLAQRIYQKAEDRASLPLLSSFIKVAGAHRALDLAEDAYKRGIQLDPQNHFIYEHFIYAAWHCRNKEKGVKVYRDCINHNAVNQYVFTTITCLALDNKDVDLLGEIYSDAIKRPHLIDNVSDFHEKMLALAYKDDALLKLIYTSINEIFNNNSETHSTLMGLYREAYQKSLGFKTKQNQNNDEAAPLPVQLTAEQIAESTKIVQRIIQDIKEDDLLQVKTLFSKALKKGYLDTFILNTTLEYLNTKKEYHEAWYYYNHPKSAKVQDLKTHSIMTQMGVTVRNLSQFNTAFVNEKKAFKALNAQLDIEKNLLNPHTPYLNDYVSFLNKSCLSFGYLGQIHASIDIYQDLKNNKVANEETFTHMLQALILAKAEHLIPEYYGASIRYSSECSLNFTKTHRFLLQQRKPSFLKLVYELAIKGNTIDPELNKLFCQAQQELMTQLNKKQLDLEGCRILMEIAGDAHNMELVLKTYDYILEKTDIPFQLLMMKIASENNRKDLVDLAYKNAIELNGRQLTNQIRLAFQRANNLLKRNIQNPLSAPFSVLTQETFANSHSEEKNIPTHPSHTPEPRVVIHPVKTIEVSATSTYEHKDESPVGARTAKPSSSLPNAAHRSCSIFNFQPEFKRRPEEQEQPRRGLNDLKTTYDLSDDEEAALRAEHFGEDAREDQIGPDEASFFSFRNYNN